MTKERGPQAELVLLSVAVIVPIMIVDIVLYLGLEMSTLWQYDQVGLGDAWRSVWPRLSQFIWSSIIIGHLYLAVGVIGGMAAARCLPGTPLLLGLGLMAAISALALFSYSVRDETLFSPVPGVVHVLPVVVTGAFVYTGILARPSPPSPGRRTWPSPRPGSIMVLVSISVPTLGGLPLGLSFGFPHAPEALSLLSGLMLFGGGFFIVGTRLFTWKPDSIDASGDEVNGERIDSGNAAWVSVRTSVRDSVGRPTAERIDTGDLRSVALVLLGLVLFVIGLRLAVGLSAIGLILTFVAPLTIPSRIDLRARRAFGLIAVGIGLFVLGLWLWQSGVVLSVLGLILIVTGALLHPYVDDSVGPPRYHPLALYTFALVSISALAILAIGLTFLGFVVSRWAEARPGLQGILTFAGPPLLCLTLLLGFAAFGLLRVRLQAWWLAVAGSLGSLGFGTYWYLTMPVLPPGSFAWLMMVLGSILLAHLFILVPFFRWRAARTST
jgi:hypothetical protein